jgi:hypothetical protein
VVLDPPRHQVVLGPGQRHVQQAALLGGVLGRGESGGLVEPRRPLPRHVDEAAAGHRPGAGRRVVEHREGHLHLGHVPGIRHQDHRPLQALGGVDGLDLDGVGVGLEPPLALLGFLDVLVDVGPGLVHGDVEPSDERPEPAASPHGVHLLGDVGEVGHDPLPVGEGQDAGRHGGVAVDGGDEGGDPFVLEEPLPSPHPLLEVEHVVLGERRHLLGRQADETARWPPSAPSRPGRVARRRGGTASTPPRRRRRRRRRCGPPPTAPIASRVPAAPSRPGGGCGTARRCGRVAAPRARAARRG